MFGAQRTSRCVTALKLNSYCPTALVKRCQFCCSHTMVVLPVFAAVLVWPARTGAVAPAAFIDKLDLVNKQRLTNIWEDKWEGK